MGSSAKFTRGGNKKRANIGRQKAKLEAEKTRHRYDQLPSDALQSSSSNKEAKTSDGLSSKKVTLKAKIEEVRQHNVRRVRPTSAAGQGPQRPSAGTPNIVKMAPQRLQIPEAPAVQK